MHGYISKTNTTSAAFVEKRKNNYNIAHVVIISDCKGVHRRDVCSQRNCRSPMDSNIRAEKSVATACIPSLELQLPLYRRVNAMQRSLPLNSSCILCLPRCLHLSPHSASYLPTKCLGVWNFSQNGVNPHIGSLLPSYKSCC